jgi:cadherin EGF LAG seven-pass G-type receptor 1
MKPIDREQTSRYEMIISASDGAATATSNLIVVILDINDNPPQFESDRIRLFIQENSAVGKLKIWLSHSEANVSIDPILIFPFSNFLLLGNVVGTITAFDPDMGQNALIIFSIIGGPDANSFTLNAPQQPANSGTASADILTRIELDYESPNKKYDIIVRAASAPLRSDVQVEIWVCLFIFSFLRDMEECIFLIFYSMKRPAGSRCK